MPVFYGKSLKMSEKDNPPMATRVSRTALIEDIRQLTNIIETTHPAPYFKGGGRIAYHRRLQKLIQGIPPEGMTDKAFIFYLMPFLASIRDGHTTILDESILFDHGHPGGIPLVFGAIEGKLCVRAVVRAAQRELIGSLLVSVAGIGVDDLLERVEHYFGCENQYQVLGKLGNRPALLFYQETLKLLIPEWQAAHSCPEITVALQHPDGDVHMHVFDTAASNAPAQIKSEHPDHLLPLSDPINPDFFFQFVDETGHSPGEIAVLRIANMTTFREMYEYFRANGMDRFEAWGRRIYQRFHPDTAVPVEYEDVIAGIPAASSVFCDLFKAMKAAQTRYLIVDLRDNQGGNSLMNQILTYYLVGFEKTVALLRTNGTVRKMSEFLASYSKEGIDLAQLPYYAQVPLNITDYDFSLDPDFSGAQYEGSIRANLEMDFAKMSSFCPEFESREHEALYFPEHIFILSSELTFSTGYNLMVDLHRLGGEIVGIPSGQAGNSFGDVRSFELANTKFRGNVSTKSFIAFPDDPEAGTLLKPLYPLTYEQFKAYDFDENATLRYALSLIADSE
jgi:hypothetical protein